MRHNVTTPGGFFVGLGGIAAFCAVAAGVYSWVEKPASNSELLPQQKSLGWVVEEDKKAERPKIAAFLEKAANEYNGGKALNLNNLDDLRGVTRFREAHESNVTADALLTAKSTVEGKNVLQAAMAEVSKEIAAKKPAASAVKVDLLPPAADAPVSMPNFQGGGAKTVTFPAPLPVEPAKPAAKLESSDSTRVNSELGRAHSDSTRVNSELGRADSDSTHVNSELGRADSDSTRVKSELPRVLKLSESGLTAKLATSAAPAPNRPPLLNWSDLK